MGDDEQELLKMDGSDLLKSDYTDSLHYKINFALKKGQGIGDLDPHLCPPLKPYHSKIQFGTTKLSEYQNVAQLGKGTYGEVFKCIHSKTNSMVAIKSFLFEVSFSNLPLIFLFRMFPMA